MKRNKLLINLFYRFFLISFWLMILTFVVGLSLNIFKKDAIGNFKVISYHSKGYPMPVTLSLKVKQPQIKKIYKINTKVVDSLGKKNVLTSTLTVHTPLEGERRESPLFFERYTKDMGYTRKQLDSILKKPTEVKYIGNRFTILKDFKELNFLKVVRDNDNFNLSTYIYVKSQSVFFTICQLFNTYSNILVLILIFYFFKKIFKGFRKKISFDTFLPKRIKIIGVLLVLWQLKNLIISYIFTKFYDSIELENFQKYEDIEIRLNYNFDFSITYVAVGLLFLVLSILLKAGDEIKQENDLTI